MTCILYPLYLVVKSVERLNVRYGSGAFPVGGNGWKCLDCVKNEGDEHLCTECRISWLQEVGHMDYSDQLEQRIGIISGASLLVMGVCAMLINESIGVWEQDTALDWITSSLASFLQPLHQFNTAYNVCLLVMFSIAGFMAFASLATAFFFVLMNPTGKRHWRHMTPGMYAILVGEVVYLVALLSIGALFCMKQSPMDVEAARPVKLL
ncbi:hypothetical protein B0O99DRAFT_610854 [Bisporella sp. PMI_857]|nr:hypothetical protein B0O99DRAFT_612352 [Bisporella sp. PMI_857]KAH8600518.1 hypothetical protein B0O99DRAFT_610854 [Bisporella sp. PMI_857]